MTRAFVALPLPESLRNGLARLAADLPGGRLVDADNLHLTLVFAGEQPDRVLEEFHDALSAIRAPAFELKLEGLGVFGAQAPRTVWVGVRPEPRLSALHAAVARAARRAGIDLPRRRFVPHVTISRFRDGFAETDAFTRFVAANAGAAFPIFSARMFVLYASTLTRSGPVYEELAAYPLSAS